MRTILLAALVALGISPVIADTSRPIVDAHIHYSHDTWDVLPPPEAVKLLRQAGVKKAFVSSSSDDGTQMLYKAAPDLIVPVLRPYRTRGEIGTWVRDLSIIAHVQSRLAVNTYAGIGLFDGQVPDITTILNTTLVKSLYDDTKKVIWPKT